MIFSKPETRSSIPAHCSEMEINQCMSHVENRAAIINLMKMLFFQNTNKTEKEKEELGGLECCIRVVEHFSKQSFVRHGRVQRMNDKVSPAIPFMCFLFLFHLFTMFCFTVCVTVCKTPVGFAPKLSFLFLPVIYFDISTSRNHIVLFRDTFYHFLVVCLQILWQVKIQFNKCNSKCTQSA